MGDHAGWLEDIFDPIRLKKCAVQLSKRINEDKESLDISAIAIRGVSGIAIAGIVSIKTNLPLIIVRKKDESHSCRDVEFPSLRGKINYCIIDEFIRSGNTINEIIGKINSEDEDYTPVKIYLYHETETNYTYSKFPPKIPVSSFTLNDNNLSVKNTKR